MKKSDMTRQRILGVATRLFATQGYSATGFRQIARDAAVSLNTITYHFGSKESLFQESIELVVEEHFGFESLFEDEMKRQYETAQQASEGLLRIVMHMMHASLGNDRRWQMIFLMRALMDGSNDQVRSILDHLHRAEAGFRRIIDKGSTNMDDRDFRFWQRQLRAQILFFASSDRSVKQEFAEESYTDAFIDEIARRVATNCALSAGLPAPA